MANISDIIQYEGDNSIFIWKSDKTDFNTRTQLIVHESQEAVFYMNGQLLDVFGPGRHTLETQNIPLIRKFYNKAFGDKTPFHCEVYFVNKTEQMAVKWGTDSKLEYEEPAYGFPIQIGARGEMNLRVKDAKRLLVKVIGTETNFTRDSLVQKFRAFLMTKLKSYLAGYIRKNAINIFQIDERLTEISAVLLEMLVPDFEEYGLSLIHFFVTDIAKPEEDSTYRRFKEIHFRQYADIREAKIRQEVSFIEQDTKKRGIISEAEGLSEKRRLEGYSYIQERGFDVAEAVAKNEASGEMVNMGMGIGVMTGIGNTMGGLVGGSIENAVGVMQSGGQNVQKAQIFCQKCNTPVQDRAKFCPECGEKIEILNENEIICPFCQNRTINGKFCSECGAKLIKSCPECGSELPEGVKFCPECGEKLGGEEK